MTTRRKRRSPGEGSVWEYREKNGTVRYAIGHPSFGTRRRGPHDERWHTRKDAQAALRVMLTAAERGELTDPSKQPLGAYLAAWLDGHPDIGESTRASYAKNIRLHITPYLGTVPLASLTSVQVNGLYRTLRTSGRKDYKAGGPLSARTVRYIATILAAALQDAVDTRPQLLQFNPADSRQAKPPSAKFARAPEMHPWNAAQLGAFLTWSRTTGHPHTAAWHVLAMTGMRRGEVLGLLWGDVDLDAGTLAVRRSAGMVKVKGVRGVTISGDTKTGRARVVDLDPGTVAVLRAHKAARGALHLDLARDAALVFGDEHGRFLRPDGFSRTFVDAVARCAAAGHDVPRIRLHDLRHTHASLLQTGRVASDASWQGIRRIA